jgi:hypothetical protein
VTLEVEVAGEIAGRIGLAEIGLVELRPGRATGALRETALVAAGGKSS